MLLAVGLGNPGPRYAGNRHNIGFMAVDAVAGRYLFPAWRSKFQAEISEGDIAGVPVLLMKPTTFMNESGRAIAGAVRFYKLSPGDVTVLYDELDLAPGKVRVKTGGGLAGHNGLRSINAHVGPDFRRVRIGIGHPGDKDRVTGHVLKDFAKADRTWLDPLLGGIADHFPLLVAGDEGAFMSKVALAVTPPRPKPAAGDKAQSASRVVSDVTIRRSGDDGV
jgi:PTH1 family peptidyl-tRNA hydrolase